ncbi:MAG: hypothetical protein Q9183_000659 [Haloplaca sp. 2 TL-2023]
MTVLGYLRDHADRIEQVYLDVACSSRAMATSVNNMSLVFDAEYKTFGNANWVQRWKTTDDGRIDITTIKITGKSDDDGSNHK